MSRRVGDKAVLVGLGLEGARGRAFDEGLAAQGYQPAIDALAGAGAGARPIPRVGDRLRPEDWERLPQGAAVDVGDGMLANLLVRGPSGWGYASVTGGGPPLWDGTFSSDGRAARHPSAVLIGLGLDPKRHATEAALREALAEQDYQPAKRDAASAQPAPVELRVGDKVGPDDWSRLPVGAVVDSGDGTGVPFLVRGPDGWGWACAKGRGVSWPGHMNAPRGLTKARLTALGYAPPADRSDIAAASKRLREILAQHGTQVDANGRVIALTPPAPTPSALRPGDPIARWADLPDGGVAVDSGSGVAVRVGDRRGWPRAMGTWGSGLDLPFDLGGETLVRFVGIVPAPVTIERVRALVEATPLSQPTASPAAPAEVRAASAADLCRRARDRRVAALRKALAAAEARAAELAEIWTVTGGGGIVRRTAGRRSRVAGVVCPMADMPGGDKRAKRAEASRRVAERDDQRAAALAEVERLRAALYPGPTAGRTFLDVGGARVEVSANPTAAEVAAALVAAGIRAVARGGTLTVDLEGGLAGGQVAVATFDA